MEISSAIIEAQIIDVIPPEFQTAGNIKWVKSELAVKPPATVLDDVKRYLEVSNSEVLKCKNQLENMGVDLYSHIKETRQKFAEHDVQISELKTRLEVAEKVADVRHEAQKEINALTSQRINSTESNVVRAASNKGWFGHNPTSTFFVLVMCLFVVPMMLTGLGSVVNQAGRQQAPIQKGY